VRWLGCGWEGGGFPREEEPMTEVLTGGIVALTFGDFVNFTPAILPLYQ